MSEYKRLPEAELEVMQIIWAADSPVTAAEVQQQAAKGWKSTSVLTFLARLTEKGFLRCEKEGRQNRYTPAVSREAYQHSEGPKVLQALFGGSVKKLVASLSEAGAATEADLDELRTYLESHRS